MADSQLYEETFRITSINSAKYDRVSRIVGSSLATSDTRLSLDVNTEIYPLSVGETITLVLATTLSLDGTKDERSWRDVSRGGAADATLADMYDYVCRGKIYRFEDGGDEGNLKVYVSFGGLLLYLDGPWKKLTGLRIEHVYMLIKK